MIGKQRISWLLTLGFCLAIINSWGQSVKGSNNATLLSLSFNELPNTIQVEGKDLTISKFSKTLRIDSKGITQYKGNNIAYTIFLTLPDFNFNNSATNHYTNETSHFFDANRDAALILQLDTSRFGNLYRSKAKADILSKVATTDYSIDCVNQKDKKGNYIILIRINSGSVLQESSETKEKSEEQTIHIAPNPQSQILVINPQPSLPKVESYKFKSSSEAIRPNGTFK